MLATVRLGLVFRLCGGGDASPGLLAALRLRPAARLLGSASAAPDRGDRRPALRAPFGRGGAARRGAVGGGAPKRTGNGRPGPLPPGSRRRPAGDRAGAPPRPGAVGPGGNGPGRPTPVLPEAPP